MDIVTALGSVDETLLVRSEHPLRQRSRALEGLKLAFAAVLVLALGVGGFLLLRSRSARTPAESSSYALPTFETDAPPVTMYLETPIGYNANWDALQRIWAEEGSLLAAESGSRTELAVAGCGDVPEEYDRVLRQNSFYGAKSFGRRLLVSRREDDTASVSLLNLSGAVLSRCTQPCDGNHSVSCMTTTSDQGFLFVLGGKSARDNSTVVKCADGSVQWTRELVGASADMLKYCFEADGAYYFFGTGRWTTVPVDNPGNLSLLCLNADGSVRTQTVLGGRNDDRLLCAVQTEDGFGLYMEIQPSDGFPEAWTYLFRLDTTLEALSAQPAELGEGAYPLGEVDGETILSCDNRLADFPYGQLGTVVDLGDRLLTVSEYFSGTPDGKASGLPGILGGEAQGISVYAAFDKRGGTLLWRAVVTGDLDSADTNPLRMAEPLPPLWWLQIGVYTI